MNESLLFETVERYADGRMQAEEKALFEDMRKKNSEFDQLVVEHIRFMGSLDSYGRLQALKHKLHQIDNKLVEEGSISNIRSGLKGRAVYIWNRYRRSVAIAASIAGFISLISSGLLITYNKKYGNENYIELVNRINKTHREVELLMKSKQAEPVNKPKPEVEFRATGFLIGNKGLLVTNAHVAGKMKNIFVENGKGDYFNARVLCSDLTTDLALLQIIDSSFHFTTPIPYTFRKNNANLGERFFTLGFPRKEIVYGEGYLSAKTGNGGDSLAYQLTVSANPGNSGAPVVNQSGEVIGVITGKDPQSDGVVFATKSQHIQKLLDKCKEQNPSFPQYRLPSSGDLGRMDRSKQIRAMENFVFMVAGN